MLEPRISGSLPSPVIYPETDTRQYANRDRQRLPTPGYSSGMDPQKIGAALRAHRQRLEKSQTDVAVAAGVSQSTVARAEVGDFKRFESWMLKAATYLGFEFEPDDIGVLESEQMALRRPSPIVVNSQNLSVYGASPTNDGSVVVSDDPVDFAPMPSLLSNVRDAYGLLIVDDTMRPEFRVGDTALVHPYLPPVPDEPCVFRATARGGPAVVRTFQRETATHWIVSQHNPDKTHRLPKSEWPVCHRAVGRYNRR